MGKKILNRSKFSERLKQSRGIHPQYYGFFRGPLTKFALFYGLLMKFVFFRDLLSKFVVFGDVLMKFAVRDLSASFAVISRLFDKIRVCFAFFHESHGCLMKFAVLLTTFVVFCDVFNKMCRFVLLF